MVALVTRAHFRYLGKLLVWQGVPTRWLKISGEMAEKVRADGKLAPIYAAIRKRDIFCFKMECDIIKLAVYRTT